MYLCYFMWPKQCTSPMRKIKVNTGKSQSRYCVSIGGTLYLHFEMKGNVHFFGLLAELQSHSNCSSHGDVKHKTLRVPLNVKNGESYMSVN